jgi:hypothetical protein
VAAAVPDSAAAVSAAALTEHHALGDAGCINIAVPSMADTLFSKVIDKNHHGDATARGTTGGRSAQLNSKAMFNHLSAVRPGM